jgi:hypothetical protein
MEALRELWLILSLILAFRSRISSVVSLDL